LQGNYLSNIFKIDLFFNKIFYIFKKLLDIERKFFAFCAETLNKFTNIKTTLDKISKNYKRPDEQYNPLKYIRGSKLLDESFITSNFPNLDYSKKADKDDIGEKKVKNHEDYLKKAKEERLKNESSNQNKNKNETNNNNESSNKFIQDYLQKQKTMNNNNNNNNQKNTNNMTTDNDFFNIKNNFSNNNDDFRNNLKKDPFEFSMPSSDDNPYGNIDLNTTNTHINLNRNSYANSGFNFGNNSNNNNFPGIGNTYYGQQPNNNFPMNQNYNMNMNAGNMANFAMNNPNMNNAASNHMTMNNMNTAMNAMNNMNLNNNNNNNNKNNMDFFDINNLNFPK
jgi:hypothetical protein